MATKEIEKLKERVEKDPNSKLFVPLAEEYRKEGMLDDAVQVLLSGIERQPGYMSARVSLGKIYLEKGMTREAQSEFEEVVRTIPDNLYAHKKLAEIYRSQGERDLAVRAYRTVLKLNALDDDAIRNLQDMEGVRSAAEEPQDGSSVTGPSVSGTAEAEGVFSEAASETASAEPGFSQDSSLDFLLQSTPHDDDIDAFRNSFSGEELQAVEGVPEEIVSDDDEAMTLPDDMTEVPDEEVTMVPEDEVTVVPEDESDETGPVSFADIDVTEETFKPHVEETPQDTPVWYAEEEGDGAEDEVLLPEDTNTDEQQENAPIVSFSLHDADPMISAGDFAGALNVYRGILRSDPGDAATLQRVEELRALLKLLGKDKEVLIARLNEFLEAVQKRRDVFFRSS